ncbi:MAG: glutathione peroxidase [Bdellovibrionales bacterium]|nr:glutathione peroxidase [Bdellovibrionales bacterium]
MALDLSKYEMRSLEGELIPFKSLQGKVLLIVNVASRCGFTPQYEGLQALHEKFKDRGFSVLGFPCNQFGFQEPGSAQEIADFCSTSYQVSFPVFEKVKVNGMDADPIFRDLKKEAPGVLGKAPIAWNFTKFLFDRDGNVVSRYNPTRTPESIASEIEKLLA